MPHEEAQLEGDVVARNERLAVPRFYDVIAVQNRDRKIARLNRPHQGFDGILRRAKDTIRPYRRKHVVVGQAKLDRLGGFQRLDGRDDEDRRLFIGWPDKRVALHKTLVRLDKEPAPDFGLQRRDLMEKRFRDPERYTVLDDDHLGGARLRRIGGGNLSDMISRSAMVYPHPLHVDADPAGEDQKQIAILGACMNDRLACGERRDRSGFGNLPRQLCITPGDGRPRDQVRRSSHSVIAIKSRGQNSHLKLHSELGAGESPNPSNFAGNKYRDVAFYCQGVANKFVGMVDYAPQDGATGVRNMLKTFRFNPSFQTDEEAIATFKVRLREFREIMDDLSSDEPVRQRILIVAPRGAGKTTLCRRVLAEVRTNIFLQDRWVPIYLGEESYAATTPGEFLLECLYHLAQDSGQRSTQMKHSQALQIEDETRLRSFCLDAFRALAPDGKRFLIFVENFHTILNEQIGRNADDLVSLLCDERLFGVLATSVKSRTDEDNRRVEANFTYVPLKPLTLDECHTLWEALTQREVERARIRPLQILTGGSPRLLHILADFMKTPSLRDLMENLSFLIDQNTEYFKSQLDALPSQERKVFVALLEAWDPSTAKQISEVARVTINNASAMLNRLADRGAVVKQPGSGRIILYNAAERLFNIYYLMRRRSHPSSRVRALVAFMTQYYDREELVDTTALLALEACEFAPSGRTEYHNAFDAILKDQPESIRSEILKRTPADFLESLRKDPTVSHYSSEQQSRSADSDLEDMLGRAREMITSGQKGDGKALLLQAATLAPTDYRPWISLAFAEMDGGSREDGVAHARKAVELGGQNPVPHIVLGVLLVREKRLDEAEAEFQAALAIDPDMPLALIELARLRRRTKQDAEALDFFARAAEHTTLTGPAASDYAYLLAERGETTKAETILRTALLDDNDDDDARYALASLLLDTQRGEEAADLLRRAAESGQDEDRWISYVSFLLAGLDQPVRAVEAAESALEHGIVDPGIFTLLARAKEESGAPADEFLDIARRLSATGDMSEAGLVARGRILQLAGDLKGAEAAYREAGSLLGSAGYPMLLLGRMLSNEKGRLGDAVDALERAFAQAPSHCGPLKEMAEVRIHQGNDAEATRLLERALTINPTCECSLVLQAEIASRSGDREAALRFCNRALDIDPDNVSALTLLARVSGSGEATELIERAFASDPSDPRVLLARSRLGSRDMADRIDDAATALKIHPRFVEARLELVSLYAQDGHRDAAIRELTEALKELPLRMEVIPAFVAATVRLIALGYLEDVLALLSSDHAAAVEPLAVAVKKFSGQKPVVAKEVEEVADDILKTMRELPPPRAD